MKMTSEEMAVAVHEAVASIEDEGICGLATHSVVEVIQGLHKSPSSTALADKLIQSLHHAAEALICGTEHPTLTSLMVLFTLSKDIESGGAAPPANHPCAAAWAALIPKLRMALISALAVYPVKASPEGRNKQDLLTAAGALVIMLFPKTKELGQPMLQLACEAALLRLLQQVPGCIEYMRDLDGLLLHSLRDEIASAPQVTMSLEELKELEAAEDIGEEDEEDEEDEGEEDEEQEEEAAEEEEEEEEEEEAPQPRGKKENQRAEKRSQPASRSSNGKRKKF